MEDPQEQEQGRVSAREEIRKRNRPTETAKDSRTKISLRQKKKTDKQSQAEETQTNGRRISSDTRFTMRLSGAAR